MNADPATSTDAMVPLPYAVVGRSHETHDAVSLRLAPRGAGIGVFRPGQFTMLYAPGVGEIAISISGDPSDGHELTQTVRDVGAVSAALCAADVGAVVGVRGPFGTDWELDAAQGADLVVVAGGVGLAPVRPVLLAALARRADYGRIVLVVGARTPKDFLFRDELAQWAARDDVTVLQTVDVPAAGWGGRVGFVTEPLAQLLLRPDRTAAFVCGPEPMMRFCANVLLGKGVPADRIRVSLERAMKCGVGLCGHCQLGPLLVCRDGPVADWSQVEQLLVVPEL